MQGESEAGHEVVIVVMPVVVTTDVMATADGVMTGLDGPVSGRAPEANDIDAVPVLVRAAVVVLGVATAGPEIGLYGRNEIRL